MNPIRQDPLNEGGNSYLLNNNNQPAPGNDIDRHAQLSDFEDLPYELLERIFSSESISLRDFQALCVASRTFYQLSKNFKVFSNIKDQKKVEVFATSPDADIQKLKNTCLQEQNEENLELIQSLICTIIRRCNNEDNYFAEVLWKWLNQNEAELSSRIGVFLGFHERLNITASRMAAEKVDELPEVCKLLKQSFPSHCVLDISIGILAPSTNGGSTPDDVKKVLMLYPNLSRLRIMDIADDGLLDFISNQLPNLKSLHISSYEIGVLNDEILSEEAVQRFIKKRPEVDFKREPSIEDREL